MISPAPVARLHRRVRNLRLACHDAGHARRARILLEDALRTASVDDAGRLILVRRLDLGPMPLRASATAWSLRLEQRLADALPSTPVAAASPAAATASAVYFASADAPWFLAAERAARGIPCPEWFWPLALPDWHAAQPASLTLAQAFRALAARPDGLVLTVHLGRRLDAQGTLPALLSILPPELIAALPDTPRAKEHAHPSAPADVALLPLAQPSTGETPPFAPLSAAFVRHAKIWGRQDPRTRWLAAVLATPTVAASGDTPSSASLAALAFPSAEQIAAVVAALYFPPSRPSASPIPPPAKPAAPAANPPPSPAPRPDTQPPPQAPAPDRRATSAGGLLFLLPLLERAGLPDHLQTLPVASRAACVSQLFHLALRHARAPAGDPLHELFPAPALSFARSPAWFLLAVARMARRLEIPLRELIRRPALVSATPTHLDVFFRPGDADLRVRRAGLDIDPGWLPWLGLVVHFHYTRED